MLIRLLPDRASIQLDEDTNMYVDRACSFLSLLENSFHSTFADSLVIAQDAKAKTHSPRISGK
jgi:hypothetical protein